MLKYKILKKLLVLNCVFVRCVYGDTDYTEVMVLCLLNHQCIVMDHLQSHITVRTANQVPFTG